MTEFLKKEGNFTYAEAGEGRALIVLHGLMGALSNFDETFKYFSKKGYQVLIPELPLYTLPLLKTNVKNLASFLHDFIEYKELKDVVLLGKFFRWSYCSILHKHYPKDVGAIVLTGSSGLYEKSMGDSYPKRGNYEYIRNKSSRSFLRSKSSNKRIS